MIADRHTYGDLVSAGAVAPESDPYLYFDQDKKRRRKPARPEESIAKWLDANGVQVRSVNEGATDIQGRVPDAVIDSTKVTVEMKTIDPVTQERSNAGAVERRVSATIRDAGEQSPYVVIDARNVSARPSQIEAGMRSAIHHRGNSLKQVIVVLDGDQHVEWRP